MLDAELVPAIDGHAARAWPATIREHTSSGWLLRATPGLDRSRSNTALPPDRELRPAELSPAIARVTAFARRHEIAAAIQVSPLELHGRLDEELASRGWRSQLEVRVLAAGPWQRPSPASPSDLSIDDHASGGWLAAWARCEPGRDVPAHERTVFPLMRGRALFARLGERAVAIAVPADGLLGLFCLAVAAEHRRHGLARTLVTLLLARGAGARPYLQVEADNVAALALYRRLGFFEAYTYRHRFEPSR